MEHLVCFLDLDTSCLAACSFHRLLRRKDHIYCNAASLYAVSHRESQSLIGLIPASLESHSSHLLLFASNPSVTSGCPADHCPRRFYDLVQRFSYPERTNFNRMPHFYFWMMSCMYNSQVTLAMTRNSTVLRSPWHIK